MTELAGPDGSFVSTGACNLGVPGSNPGRDGYLSSWLCIYTVLQTVQRHGVYSAAYGTRYCHDCTESDVVVVVNDCFTSLFGTYGLLSDIVIR